MQQELGGTFVHDTIFSENNSDESTRHSVGIYMPIEEFYNMEIIKSTKAVNKYDL